MISKPRIFLADENRQSFDFFKCLIDRQGWAIAGYAEDFESFISRAPQSEADVMLVSAGFLGVMNARDRRTLKSDMPGRIILAITDSDDFAELKAAVRAGARDCLNAADQSESSAGVIYEYFAEAASAKDRVDGRAVFNEDVQRLSVSSGRVFAFCGGDGGTGKSFLAFQAAGMAALHAGAKICLIDYDLRFGALSAVIGDSAPGVRSLADLADVIDEIQPFHIESLLREHDAGFSVICGPAPELADRVGLLANIVEPLKEIFDAVIIDFPPNPGSDFPAALVDVCFIPVTPDRVSACCARQMALVIGAANENAEIIGIINRSDRTGALKPAEIARLSGLKIAAEVPEDEGAGLLFDSKGKPFAASTNLSVVKGLVPAVQRIKDFDELSKPNRLPLFSEWRPPWVAKPGA